MEMQTYDEDLWENPFFVRLQQENPVLYNSASNRGWLIVIPKSGSLEGLTYTEALFLTHVLIPEETDGSFKTLSNKELTIKNNIIETGIGFSRTKSVAILFEETFYNNADKSFRVVCIDQPLEGVKVNSEKASETTCMIAITSLDDCTQLLWGQSGNTKTSRHLHQVIDLFSKTCVRLEGESLRHQVDAANVLFTKAMQIVLKDSMIKKNANGNIHYMDTIKLAVETYTLHGVFNQLFKNILVCMAKRDAKLNKITRNLKEIQLKQLGVRPEFGEYIPSARREFYSISRYTTPLGKLNCVRRMMAALTGQHLNSSSTKNGEPLALTSDDLLPILVFLVIKSDIPNWWANFAYMKSFRFSRSSNDDEYGFYLATLEAALDYINQGDIIDIHTSAPNSPHMFDLSSHPESEQIWKPQETVEAKTVKLFECVENGDVEDVENLLSGRAVVLEDIKDQLCHPLCECPRCSEIVAQTHIDPSLVTTYSRDHRGCTVLHISAQKGFTEMTELLIRHGAVVNATDYQGMTPLHHVCLKGHQAVTLLLLHHKAQVNLQDNDGNSALHLATANGHAECVKALVYYDQGSTTLKMQLANDLGETALHVAARWGYENLVEILLESGSSVRVENRRHQTPLHVAHNLRVAYRLRQALQEETEREERLARIHRLSKSGLSRKDSSASLLSSGRYDSLPRQDVTSPEDVHSPEATVIQSKSNHTADVASPPRSAPTNLRRETSQSIPSSHKKQVDKLLKSVADGDSNMVKFQLGWSDEDLDRAEDVDTREFCHPLCQCAKCQPLQKLARASPSGLHVNSANSSGFTPLLMGALHGHVTLVDLFIKAGASINAKTLGQEYSALHLACQSNSPRTVEMLKLLLDHGARVNQRDAQANTALHFCCLKGNVPAVKLLLQHGANVNAVNMRGNTGLHEAVKLNFHTVVWLLLEEGAALIPNKQNLTPLQLTQDVELQRLLSTVETVLPSATHRGQRVTKSSEDKLTGALESDHSKEMSKLKQIFDTLEDKDLARIQELTASIQHFDRKSSLKPAVTRDRSRPRLYDIDLDHNRLPHSRSPAAERHTKMCDLNSGVSHSPDTFKGAKLDGSDPEVKSPATSSNLDVDNKMQVEVLMQEAREMLEHSQGKFSQGHSKVNTGTSDDLATVEKATVYKYPLNNGELCQKERSDQHLNKTYGIDNFSSAKQENESGLEVPEKCHKINCDDRCVTDNNGLNAYSSYFTRSTDTAVENTMEIGNETIEPNTEVVNIKETAKLVNTNSVNNEKREISAPLESQSNTDLVQVPNTSDGSDDIIESNTKNSSLLVLSTSVGCETGRAQITVESLERSYSVTSTNTDGSDFDIFSAESDYVTFVDLN